MKLKWVVNINCKNLFWLMKVKMKVNKFEDDNEC